MLKLIAILALSSNLSVAVETDTGWQEKTFPNNRAGAEQLVDYAEKAVGDPPNGVKVIVGTLDEGDSEKHILEFLRAAGVPHGLAMPKDVKAAAVEQGISENSPRAVAASEIKRFGFLHKGKTVK
jgi:hypothetical protein